MQESKPTYDYSEIGNTPTIPTVPTNVSAFNNDAGYLTSHQDISGKEDSSNKVTSFQSTPDDTHYPSEKLVKDSLDTKIDNTDVEELTAIDVDNTPTANSSNLVTSGGVYTALSNKEDNSNKITTLLSSSTDTQYPSAKAIYDSFYRYGVISQTQTWTQASDGGYDYTMSNLVYGNIPQSNIDLFVSAGATFNSTTGYFELNTLTDISYQEMMNIYNFMCNSNMRSFNRYMTNIKNVRTNLPLPWYGKPSGDSRVDTISTNMFGLSSIEVFLMPEEKGDNRLDSVSAFTIQAYYLKKIINKFNVIGFYGGYFMSAPSLVDIRLAKIVSSFSISSKRISKESLLYMINNEAATSNITITLKQSVYSVMSTDADIQAALANHTYISLASE